MKPAPRTAITTAFAAIVMAILAFPATAGGVIYIPLGSAGEITIVNTGQDRIIGKIGNLPAVHGLAGTPDGQFLIAGSYDKREAGSKAPAKPSAVSEAEHAAHHGGPSTSSGKADSASAVSTVSVVRTADRSVVRRIDVPGAVHHVAVSPDSRTAVVTHPNQGRISAIDLTSYEVAANIATGPSPNYVTFSPDGNRVYVSNAGNGTVSAVDARRWIVQWNAVVGTTPEHVVLSKNGATLYVNNVEDGTVSVIAIDEGKVVKTIALGSTLHGIDLSDDGRTLFVAVLGDDKVVGVDLATGTRRSASLTPAPYHLATVRGRGKIYVSSADDPKVWVVDQKTLAVLGEIPIGGKGHQMVQTPGM